MTSAQVLVSLKAMKQLQRWSRSGTTRRVLVLVEERFVTNQVSRIVVKEERVLALQLVAQARRKEDSEHHLVHQARR